MSDLINTNFSLPKKDPQKVVGNLLLVGTLAAVGLMTYSKILPFLISMVYNTIHLCEGLGVLALIAFLVLNKNVRSAVNIFFRGFGKLLLGWAIVMNKWDILEEQIDAAAEDREQLKIQSTKLKGNQYILNDEIEKANKLMVQSDAEVNVAKKKLADPRIQNDQDEIEQIQLDLSTSDNNFTNAQSNITTLQPMLNTLDKSIKFLDKAYKSSGYALDNSRNTLKNLRMQYEIVDSTNKAMQSAQRALGGRAELNDQAEKAMDLIRHDVGMKIGGIKEALGITAQLMSRQDLANAAKAELASDAIDKFNIDAKFRYSDTVTGNVIPIEASTLGPNKYIDLLTAKK